MVKWLHTVCLSAYVCVSEMVFCWFSCQCGLRWSLCVCECVCVFEATKPPSTPDPLKSHDIPSVPTKHLEGGVKG